ncbi:type III secretion system protein PrgR, partial [Enterococcus faecium]|nr:type III secretion system protein PrgR [Enterococcus faecium]
YVDGKVVACRGCSELPLIVSNHVYSKMKVRQKLLKESKIRYREWQKEEWKSWRNEMFQYSKKYKRVSA